MSLIHYSYCRMRMEKDASHQMKLAYPLSCLTLIFRSSILVAGSSGVVRPVGAGHSFTALVPTDGTIVSLARMSGIVRHDADKLQAAADA